MNKKIIGAMLTAGLVFSQFSTAETYHKVDYVNNLNASILTIEDAVKLEKSGFLGMNDATELGKFFIYDQQFKDSERSFQHFKDATLKGSEYAKMMLGYMTYKGLGTSVSVYRGENILREVKKPYDKNATMLLAIVLYQDSKYDEAIELFKEVKDPISYSYLTEMLISKGKFDEAIPYLMWLSDNENSVYAKRKLGEIYLSKKNLNLDKSIKFLKDAAKLGDPEAQYTLGMFYSKGTKETIADMKEATVWFRMAAQQEHLFAMQELLKIWHDNQSNNDLYGLSNDSDLTKYLNDYLTNIHLND